MGSLEIASQQRAFSLSPAITRRSSTPSNGPLGRVKGLDPVHKTAVSLGSLNRAKTPDFEIATVNPADPRLLCPVCSQVLRYPLQFEECGHRCCSACLPEILRIAPRCPVDQVKIDRDRMFVDRALQREIDSLLVRCSYHGNGCQWTGEMRNLVVHAEDCRVRPMPCPRHCGLKVNRSLMDKHLVDACSNREMTCVCCQATIRSRDEVEHMRACGRFPVPCPNGCGIDQLPRRQMIEHTKECPKQSTICPYSDAGCSHQCLRRDLDVHLSDGYEVHLRQVTEALNRAAAEDGTAHLTDLTARVAMVEARLDNLRMIHAPITLWKIEDFDEKTQSARKIGSAALVSPLMSTKRHGYRMQLLAYLDGVDVVQGHYMSVYASLCRSDNDQLVSWPFAQTVTITLVDQSDRPGARRHVSHVLDPATVDVKGAFDCPTGPQNPAFGVARFIRLEDLSRPGRFIKDDAIFLHVKFDD